MKRSFQRGRKSFKRYFAKSYRSGEGHNESYAKNRKVLITVALAFFALFVLRACKYSYFKPNKIESWYAEAARSYRAHHLCDYISPRAESCSQGFGSIAPGVGEGCYKKRETCLMFRGSDGTFHGSDQDRFYFFYLLGFKQEVDRSIDLYGSFREKTQKELEARSDFRRRLLNLPSFAQGDEEVRARIYSLWPECASAHSEKRHCRYLACLLQRENWTRTECYDGW